jgi:3-oxoacyl-[acyl-carrier protein] reductase
MSKLLQDKVCFITGSTRGIGWAVAEVFAEHGAAVILNGRADSPALQEKAAELATRFGVETLAIAADVREPSAVGGCYPQIFKKFKRLDVLVNNAGILQDALLGMISEAAARATLDTNTLGPILHMQEAARLMGRKNAGSIINITSIIGRFGNEGQTVYAASKAAVIGMTMAAAKELAPKSIRVNAIAPGFIETDMTRQLPEAKFAERMKQVKMNRIGQPLDVANMALFLASDLSAYVTGQVIGVDGGMVI